MAFGESYTEIWWTQSCNNINKSHTWYTAATCCMICMLFKSHWLREQLPRPTKKIKKCLPRPRHEAPKEFSHLGGERWEAKTHLAFLNAGSDADSNLATNSSCRSATHRIHFDSGISGLVLTYLRPCQQDIKTTLIRVAIKNGSPYIHWLHLRLEQLYFLYKDENSIDLIWPVAKSVWTSHSQVF